MDGLVAQCDQLVLKILAGDITNISRTLEILNRRDDQKYAAG